MGLRVLVIDDHTLFREGLLGLLGRRGIEVVALDPSAVATASVAAIAEAEGLPCRPLQGGFEDHDAPEGSYAAVLIFGLIQILTRQGIRRLIDRVDAWARDGGLLLVTAFSTEDEGHRQRAARWRPVGKGSYADASGQIRTYLEPGEVLELFGRHEVLHHHEGPGPVHRHGDGPPEQHAMVEAVLRKAPRAPL